MPLTSSPRTGGRGMPCRAPVGLAVCQEARGPSLLLACDTGDILKHSVRSHWILTKKMVIGLGLTQFDFISIKNNLGN